MKQVENRWRDEKQDNGGHENSAEEAAADPSRARTQQGGGHRSGSSGAGTSEKLDRERSRTGPASGG